MIDTVTVLRGRYHDSVRLMQVTRDALGTAGAEAGLVAMATDLNLGLLEEMGFDRPVDVGPDDLIIAVRAVDESAASAARQAVEEALAGPVGRRPETRFADPAPRTAAAAGRPVGANLALISVPGRHAFVEAMGALDAGLHVMVFSDNVPVEQEILLKRTATERGLLVMGPDCGTAIVGGVGLGFANAVEPGPVGITGASGTGIQELCCLLDAAGIGVRHALGTGSRDLSASVAGISTLHALAALDADPAIEVIVVVSKPPDPAVAEVVERSVASCSTPVVLALLGTAGVTLEWAARATLDLLGEPEIEPTVWRSQPFRARPGLLRGLFSGGTLRDEARSIATPVLGPIAIEPGHRGHRMVDYGADSFTRGRAHPMIDSRIRVDALGEVVGDSSTGVILLDVVLGYGAHPDPAADLAPALSAAVDAGVGVVVSLCATGGDPQGRDRQAENLVDAGAEVYLSNAAAAARAATMTVEAAR